MWKYRYRFVCALSLLLIGATLVSNAQVADPSTLPQIKFADLTYLGAFRMPREFANGDNLEHGGSPIAFNPGRNSLFIGSRKGNVGEVTIPTPVSSGDINQLPFAKYLQGFFEPTEGTISQIPGDVRLSGLLVMGDKLYGTANVYYDADNLQRVSHYVRSTLLSSRTTIGMRQVWSDLKTGFVSGYLSLIPAEWQARLGGIAATGQCCIPIAWRTSWGPSAFSFNPTDVSSVAKVPASPLLYYSDSHPTLGQWQGNDPVYSAATEITGMAMIAGSRTVLYIGRTGTGPFCYGEGTGNTSLVGTATADGSVYCLDPTNASKGQHGYPYNYQIWAYDLNDLAAVKAGTKNPWDLRPYGVWPFSLPITASDGQVRLGGIAYDPSRQIIYISQIYGDQDTYANRPLIHALKVGGGAAGAPMPPADTTPLPAITLTGSADMTTARLTALSLVANKPAPQPAATTVTFTATPTGGVAPHQYKWLMHDGLKWTTMVDWSTANSFNWTPPSANSQYRIGVWVRGSGNTADAAEFTNSMDFAIGNSSSYTAPYETTKAVTIAADKAAPQAAGSMITWTATASGGTAPRQYKWLLHNGLAWSVAADWSTSNTFVWTPAIPNSQYRIGVWVRSAGATADAGDATNSADFAINGTATTTPPPTTTTPPPTTTTPPPTTTTSGGRLTALSLTADRPAPQPAGTTITFTSVPTGGVAPHQFKFLMHDGLKWTVMTNWTTANTFSWTPTVANSQHRIGVWVRNAGSTADAAEFTNSVDFAITAGSTTVTPPPTTTTPPPTTTTPPPTSTTNAPLTGVVLSANKIAPQPQLTTITLLATAIGGTNPLQYKWLIHDGFVWKVLGDWSTSNTFNWTPPAWNSQYRVGVWVRNAGNTIDAGQATYSIDFPITAATAAPPPPTTTTTTSSRITALAIGANKVAPQPVGSAITFTAVPTGGGAAPQYKWLIHDGLKWNVVTGWSTANTYTWAPTSVNSAYRVGVWIRSATSTVDIAEFTASMDFRIQ